MLTCRLTPVILELNLREVHAVAKYSCIIEVELEAWLIQWLSYLLFLKQSIEMTSEVAIYSSKSLREGYV